MRFIDWFKDKAKLISENEKMRKGKNAIELKYQTLQSDYTDISKKYVAFLEQKAEKFDLYIKYQEQCKKLTEEKRELKEQLAEANEKYTTLSDANTELSKKVEKLERKIKRLEKKDEKDN